MPRKTQKKGDENALNGLATSWNKCRWIREHLLKTGNLLQWPSVKQVGVIDFTTAACNTRVLSRLMKVWLPQLQVLKTINIYAARKEAREVCRELMVEFVVV